MAVRRQRRDNGETTAARQRQRWRRKKSAADLVISILIIYICVRFLVIFAILSSYLFPAVVFHLFYCFVQKFNFWRAPRNASFLTRIRVNSQNSKISFFHYLRKLRESLAQLWFLNFFFLFFQKCFLLFQFKVSQLGDCNAIRLFKLSNFSLQKQIF